MSSHAMLEALGLKVDLSLVEVELGAGVVLAMRRPVADDWCAARAAMAEVFSAKAVLAAAAQRYAWDTAAQMAMADPAVWEKRVERCLHVELAALIVTSVTRMDGQQLRSVEPSVDVFNQLFMMHANLDLFIAEVKKAEAGLITAKKE